MRKIWLTGYERRYDDDEWADPEPMDRPARLTMTLSVRFTAEELEAVRAMAEHLGMKPTAFVRQAAVEALSEHPIDWVRVANDLARAVELMRNAHWQPPRQATDDKRPESRAGLLTGRLPQRSR